MKLRRLSIALLLAGCSGRLVHPASCPEEPPPGIVIQRLDADDAPYVREEDDILSLLRDAILYRGWGRECKAATRYPPE